MTKEEFIKIADATKTYFPRFEIMPNKESLSLWYEELKDLPYNIAVAALRKYVNTPGNVFPPSIADFRECATLVTHENLQEDWSKKWAEVLKAIRNYGTWDKAAAIASFDPTTRECVERLGWEELCMSEDISVDRANFRMIYANMQKQEKELRSMPMSLKNSIRIIQCKGEVKQIEE